jgi:hypothetical protein
MDTTTSDKTKRDLILSKKSSPDVLHHVYYEPHQGTLPLAQLLQITMSSVPSALGKQSITFTVHYIIGSINPGGEADEVGLCARSWLSGNLGKTALRLTEIIRMYFDTSLKTSRRDYSGLSGPGWAVVYYESIKRELKTKPIYECRCDERPKHKDEESTRLGCTGVHDKTN